MPLIPVEVVVTVVPRDDLRAVLDRLEAAERVHDEWQVAIGDQAEALGLPRTSSVGDLMETYAKAHAARLIAQLEWYHEHKRSDGTYDGGTWGDLDDISPGEPKTAEGWRCECGDWNRDGEWSCFRCGAARPECPECGHQLHAPVEPPGEPDTQEPSDPDALVDEITEVIATGLVSWADAERGSDKAFRYPIPAWSDSRLIAEQVLERLTALPAEEPTS